MRLSPSFSPSFVHITLETATSLALFVRHGYAAAPIGTPHLRVSQPACVLQHPGVGLCCIRKQCGIIVSLSPIWTSMGDRCPIVLAVLSLLLLAACCGGEAVKSADASDVTALRAHENGSGNGNGNGNGGSFDSPVALLSIFQKNDDWPAFEISWKLILSTVLILIGSAMACASGVGGGGIFIPMFTLLLGFDPRTAAALSKSLVFVGSTTTALHNVRQRHPKLNRALIDYEMALLLQPMLMLGISLGVMCNSTFPDWVLTVLLILVVFFMAYKCFKNGLALWKKETEASSEKKMTGLQVCSRTGSQAVPESSREALLPKVAQPPTMWTEIRLMVLVWIAFSIIQIVKEVRATKCGLLYWVLNASQIPVSLLASATGAWRIWCKQDLARSEPSEAAEVAWTIDKLILYPLISCFAGTIGGFLGIGGGMILGPMFLELGISPQVTSATSTFMIMFSSSMSVLEYYLLGRLPVNFAVYFGLGILVAASVGVHIMRQLVAITGRASIITFTLGTVIGLSAIFLGLIGTLKNVKAYFAGAYMGFESLCSL